MKIFALNLCLELQVQPKDPAFRFEPLSWQAFLAQADEPAPFDGQQVYVWPEKNEEFPATVVAWQRDDAWRARELSVTLLFESEIHRTDFFDTFRHAFHEVDAAGGLVQNEAGAYLFIFHHKRWTLPKGHVEWEETIEAAAVREVKEETNLKQVQLLGKLAKTYHTFFRKGKWMLKTTHWYRMLAPGQQKLLPQTNEGITDICWMNRQEWLDIAPESFPQIRQLFELEFQRALPPAE
jgi:ADP-ribose pyrophosphatase YjhB (NUDIX family)